MQRRPIVYIVDDDPSAVDSLRWLVASAGFETETYTSPSEFLEQYNSTRRGCLILDIRMPEMNGLDLQDKLAARGCSLPVIVVTGHGDVAQCARAFRAGAFEFVEKPANDEMLIGRIEEAIELEAETRHVVTERAETESRITRLTARERNVMDLVLDGKTTKEIARELKITFQTVAKHKSRVLTKMEVHTELELARLVLPFQAQRQRMPHWTKAFQRQRTR